MSFDRAVQWLGTMCIMCMYCIMSFCPQLHPLNIVFGLAGGVCFLAWAVDAGNWPQITVNLVSISICSWGLARAWS